MNTRAVPLGEVPPVLFSECHADLMTLGGALTGEETDEEDDED
jgi:hypothetical protein